ncbi:MAG: hypothetical protein WC637_15280 [Victivallales bacterium]|jgi:hypothetical protein
MLKKLIALCLMASLFAVVGCSSLLTSKNLNGQKLTLGADESIANINVDTWGLYFLWMFIATGDMEKIGSVAWFKDTVTLDNAVGVATKKAKEMGATKSVDMTSSVAMGTFLFNVKEVQISINAVK